MTFRLDVKVSRSEYHASAPEAGYVRTGQPVCITWRPRDTALFLTIGEGEDAFQNDPDFHRMKASGELRIFDPFDMKAFEPENAAAVLRHFVQDAQTHMRGR